MVAQILFLCKPKWQVQQTQQSSRFWNQLVPVEIQLESFEDSKHETTQKMKSNAVSIVQDGFYTGSL